MRGLWRTLFEEGTFPEDVVEYVRREYYESSKAQKIMECYIFDAGNLNQTTTSRNEGSHSSISQQNNDYSQADGGIYITQKAQYHMDAKTPCQGGRCSKLDVS